MTLSLLHSLVETLEEKILSLELTKKQESESSNGISEENTLKSDSNSKEEIEYYDTETTASEPPTPTAEDKPIVPIGESGNIVKKKRRKRSKKGKH